MKLMNESMMLKACGGRTSYIYKSCEYKEKGCRYCIKAGYESSFWYFGITKLSCMLAVALRMDLHEENCRFAYFPKTKR